MSYGLEHKVDVIITLFDAISPTAREDLKNSGHFFRFSLAVAYMALKSVMILSNLKVIYTHVSEELKRYTNRNCHA